MRSLEKEKAYPLLLHYNYHGVIKPRCELLRDKIKNIDFAIMLPLSDEEFCARYDIDMGALIEAKGEKYKKDEKDILWSYVPAVWLLFF